MLNSNQTPSYSGSTMVVDPPKGDELQREISKSLIDSR